MQIEASQGVFCSLSPVRVLPAVWARSAANAFPAHLWGAAPAFGGGGPEEPFLLRFRLCKRSLVTRWEKNRSCFSAVAAILTGVGVSEDQTPFIQAEWLCCHPPARSLAGSPHIYWILAEPLGSPMKGLRSHGPRLPPGSSHGRVSARTGWGGGGVFARAQSGPLPPRWGSVSRGAELQSPGITSGEGERGTGRKWGGVRGAERRMP